MRAVHRAAMVALAAVLALSGAAPALAQAPDAATRKAARILAEEGLSLFDRGDHAAALEKFNKADALLNAPTVDLYAARCLVQLGRWVEAAARYADVHEAPVDPGAPDAYKDAIASARREHDALLARIPVLVIKVQGGTPGDLTLLLDGQPLPPDQIGADQRLDPGPHTVEARSGDATDREEITLKESERAAVELSLPEPPPPPPKPAPPPPVPADTGRLQRTLGGVALAVGAAGVAVWGVTGALALAEGVSLSDQGCAGGRCPYGVDQDTYRALRTTSMVSFWTGLVGVGAGAILLLTAPSAPAPAGTGAGATVNVWAGPLAPPPALPIAPETVPVALGLRGSF